MNFALRLPDYYKQEIQDVKGSVSINQFIVNAVSEKIASLKTIDELEKRAAQGSIEHGLSILSKVSDREPEEQDKL